MSTKENTSRPGRPGLDELVPSRYALKVGEIDVMVVSDGVLTLPGEMLGHNADAAVRTAWLEDNFQGPDVLQWALNVVVVRSGGRTILIDAGVGDAFPDFRAGQLALRLEAAGIDPASVTDVVLTHMHMDHVGGLLADGLKRRLRPDVPIHMAAAELEFWASPDFSRNTFGGVSASIRSTAKRFLDEYRSHLRLFDEECEVAAVGRLRSRNEDRQEPGALAFGENLRKFRRRSEADAKILGSQSSGESSRLERSQGFCPGNERSSRHAR